MPLNLTGWHRVTIGVWGDCFSLHHTYAPSGNRVRLSGDPCFRAFERDRTPPSDSISIEDFEVACADLTGQDLVIAPPQAATAAPPPRWPTSVASLSRTARWKSCRRTGRKAGTAG